MKMIVDLDMKIMSIDLIKVKSILANTDNMATAEVCHLYIEMCQRFAVGIVPDSTATIMDRLKAEYHDNQDRDTRHSIAGHMNDSDRATKASYKKNTGEEPLV